MHGPCGANAVFYVNESAFVQRPRPVPHVAVLESEAVLQNTVNNSGSICLGTSRDQTSPSLQQDRQKATDRTNKMTHIRRHCPPDAVDLRQQIHAMQ